MHASNGILFNHESPVRGETFVTRKITRALARIKEGLQESLYIGNLESLRDWGHARGFVEAMWLILQQDEPDDYVIATGKQYSVRQFIEAAGGELGMDLEWQGEGVDDNRGQAGNSVYNHSIYRTGLRYRGRVIGHGPDNDSRNSLTPARQDIVSLDLSHSRVFELRAN